MIAFVFLFTCLAGFSVRRGSICLVRATHEIIEKKPKKTLIFIVEGMLVAVAITTPAILFFPDQIEIATASHINQFLLAAALIYGVGASLNNGCALGSLNHLLNGRMNFLAMFAGLVFGYLIYSFALSDFQVQKVVSGLDKEKHVFILTVLLCLAWLFLATRIVKFALQGEENLKRKFKNFVSAPVSRDFLAIFLLGLSSGLLYLVLGHSWDYTNWIQTYVETWISGAEFGFEHWISLIAVLGFVLGVTAATMLSKSFKYQAFDIKTALPKFLGGTLMGIGAGLIPGGNDTLILYDAVGLALHAPIAILFVMLGIVLTTITKRAIQSKKLLIKN